MEDPIALDERQVGGHHEPRGRQPLAYTVPVVLAEQPGEDRAGLRVEIQRSPRSSSSSRRATPGGKDGLTRG